MQRAHKIQLIPNQKAIEYFNQACGIARFVFNQALAEWREWYELGGKPSGLELKRYFNSVKKEKYPWIYGVTKCASEQPLSNLDKAFKNFFAGRGKYPKFKKKFQRDSFYIANDKFSLDGKYIKISSLGWVKMTEKLRFEGKIQSATISRKADKWFVSIQVDLPHGLTPFSKNQAVGIDFGIKSFAVLSDGEVVGNPRITKRFEKQLRRLNKSLSRKVKKSKNWQKAKLRLQRLHKRIFDCRLDFLHKFTTRVARSYSRVCLEDLNIKGMLCNHKLAKHIQDISLFETRRQLEYKCQEVYYCDRFAPTSKTCWKCGWKDTEQTLGDRTFVCKQCSHVEDRDLNASYNILRWATAKVKPVDKKALTVSEWKP